jgi:hypothetical protein
MLARKCGYAKKVQPGRVGCKLEFPCTISGITQKTFGGRIEVTFAKQLWSSFLLWEGTVFLCSQKKSNSKRS